MMGGIPMRLAAFVVFALSIPAHVTAGMIPILNAGFEDQVLAGPGDFVQIIPDWGILGQADTYWPAVSAYPGGAPQGVNVAAVGDNVGGGSVTQVLTATLGANTTYTLMVDVGARLDFPFASYTVALIANGVTLASDSSLNPAAGTFLTDTIVYNSGSNPAQLGQNLEIQLSALIGGQADFDDVRLDASPTAAVPEPASLCLMISGMVSLLFYRRRR
jgi:hypothetical protein